LAPTQVPQQVGSDPFPQRPRFRHQNRGLNQDHQRVQGIDPKEALQRKRLEVGIPIQAPRQQKPADHEEPADRHSGQAWRREPVVPRQVAAVVDDDRVGQEGTQQVEVVPRA